LAKNQRGAAKLSTPVTETDTEFGKQKKKKKKKKKKMAVPETKKNAEPSLMKHSTEARPY